MNPYSDHPGPHYPYGPQHPYEEPQYPYDERRFPEERTGAHSVSGEYPMPEPYVAAQQYAEAGGVPAQPQYEEYAQPYPPRTYQAPEEGFPGPPRSRSRSPRTRSRSVPSRRSFADGVERVVRPVTRTATGQSPDSMRHGSWSAQAAAAQAAAQSGAAAHVAAEAVAQAAAAQAAATRSAQAPQQTVPPFYPMQAPMQAPMRAPVQAPPVQQPMGMMQAPPQQGVVAIPEPGTVAVPAPGTVAVPAGPGMVAVPAEEYTQYVHYVRQLRQQLGPGTWSPSSSTGRIMIVGSGPAGLAAAEEARRLGFVGRITIMGDERTGPYDRPACSKGLLNGHQNPQDALLAVPTDLELDWQLGRKAVHLDPNARHVTAHTGEIYPYDGLVIATGARPSIPKGWPTDQPKLHVLHTLNDAWALRHDLKEARRVAIVGGGLTGCEVACAVRAMAREAVIIDPRNCLMQRAIGEAAGLLVTEVHASSGIELRLGRRVKKVRYSRSWELLLDDGSFVTADVVVVANGGRPDVDWLANTGIDTSNGVLCDATLRVEGVADVVAAGVIARWPNLWAGGDPDRVGQWIAALEMGRGAMRTLLSGRRSAPAVTVIPRFWSHQNDLRIQVCGNPDPNADLHLVGRGARRPSARSGALASYYKGGHLVGLVAVNAAPSFTAAARGMMAAESAAEWHPAERTVTGGYPVAQMVG